jgi:antibiotic biosynthesis monooxygenase (ABM) superfamily enzyme
VPGKFDFICDKCGKPIAIPPDVKKKMNLLLMVTGFMILMPSFIDTSVAFWKFGLLSLLVIVISIALQYFFVSRGRFILRSPEETRR